MSASSQSVVVHGNRIEVERLISKIRMRSNIERAHSRPRTYSPASNKSVSNYCTVARKPVGDAIDWTWEPEN